MTDLHTRFRTLDSLSTPNLWSDIEERAMAMQPTRRSSAWVLIAVSLLLVLAIGGAVLVGSGIVKLPVTVDASVSPSSSALASSAASSSPVVPVPASWTATGNMIEARTSYTATRLLNDKVLVAGGVGTQISEGSANILASAELYDPSTGQWTVTGAMLGIRTGHTATLLPNGKVLVVGGSACSDFDGCPLASAELYDPGSGTWTATSSMVQARVGDHTATLLGNGKVLAAGGSGSSFDPLASAELYDPGTGAWSATGSMLEARLYHTATQLPGGKVLVAGGTNSVIDGGVASKSAELYDPATGFWTPTAGMLEAHGGPATLLGDGTVLLAGGVDSSFSSLASAERYDPGSGG